MAIKDPIKKINKTNINCKETLEVTIGITGIPNISENPADIILILDKSSSMIRDKKLENMKIGAKNQLDIITTATGGILNDKIGGGSKVGIVTFSTEAMLDVPLTTDVKILKENIDKIVASGLTNHGAAFTKAIESFDKTSKKEKIIIMFTDGALSDGTDPVPITDAAKASGIKIYCIGVENAYLNFEKWASTPTDKYIAYSNNPLDMVSLFVDIGNRIVSTGATNSKIIETINKDFKIVKIDDPTFGNVIKKSDTSLEWDINNIGKDSEERASLTFTIEHIGKEGGIKKINSDIKYLDDEKNTVTFPNPTIEINCNEEDKVIEPCPTPVEFQVEGCKDSVIVNLDNVELMSLR